MNKRLERLLELFSRVADAENERGFPGLKKAEAEIRANHGPPTASEATRRLSADTGKLSRAVKNLAALAKEAAKRPSEYVRRHAELADAVAGTDLHKVPRNLKVALGAVLSQLDDDSFDKFMRAASEKERTTLMDSTRRIVRAMVLADMASEN